MVGGVNLKLSYASTFAFLVLPVILLLVRSRAGRGFPWWAAVLVATFGGWLFVNARAHFYFAYLCEPFGQDVWSVPPELHHRFEKCVGDGGHRTFAFLFGWLYALVYACPFFLAYDLGGRWRQRRTGQQMPPDQPRA